MARAVVLGCAGPRLTAEERRFFADADPLGFILFGRNCHAPEQVRALVADLRDALGRDNAPVLIDQEGGRVQRLKPPHWRAAPPPARFGSLASRDSDAAVRAAWLNARLIAADLLVLGVTVDCTPVLDLLLPDAHAVIGDRAFGAAPETVSRLGRAVIDGMLAGGVLPVVKHLPGHGRAAADSHESLPVVDAGKADLTAMDFVPFRDLADAPWGMTAHVVYPALDPVAPATTSPSVIREAIREDIGFDGVLVSDDLSMKALHGDFRDRAEAAIGAGCDVVLHCNGDPAEMSAVVAGTPALSGRAARRVEAAERRRAAQTTQDLDSIAAGAELDALLAGG